MKKQKLLNVEKMQILLGKKKDLRPGVLEGLKEGTVVWARKKKPTPKSRVTPPPPAKPKKSLRDLEVGDLVFHTGDSGFCRSSYEKVTAVDYRYDSRTGEKYKTVKVSSGWFDTRTGHAKTPPYAYYIVIP